MTPAPALRQGIIGALGLLILVATAGAQDDEPAVETRPFALPLARDARTSAEKASDHIRAQRWSEAIVALQRLLEEHRGEVLPEAYRDTYDLHSWNEAHPGAADWAWRQLLRLPREARELYRERYEPRADRTLEQARARQNRRALVEVGRRWPLTAAASRSWWTIGDMELEQGQVRAALTAWKRATDVAELAGEPAPAGAAERQQLALGLLTGAEGEDRDGAPPSLAQALRTPDPTRERGPLPMSDAEPWEARLDLHPFESRSYYYSLLPVLAEERIFVNTTLRVFAVDAFTGDLRWQAGPPRGWEKLSTRQSTELFKGLNRKQILIAPAVGGRVTLAALQIPFSEEANEAWQGIEIRVAIPERRLFAFDSETGRPLWDHAPDLTWNAAPKKFQWDGRGSFAQRMRIAGPPVVAGTRVLVPCYRMQGRIDYHVACYQLETGALLWSTNVVSGQRERNMFGRARQEFAASPLVVAGDRVIAQTELGTVAALDLVTGELLWESLYKQIALPKTRTYQSPKRDVKWRLAPPVVVDDVVVSTPSDSPELVTFDLEDGRVLSSNSQSSLLIDSRHSGLNFNLLLGADADTVYLGGQKIGAISKSGGLAQGRPFDRGWSVEVEADRNADLTARALLCRDSILVPLRGERVVIDRSNGLVLQGQGAPWKPEHYGNALVERGFIVTLSSSGLHGFFDWNALVARQRERQLRQPDDPGVALDTAKLYARRAESVLEDGDLFGAWTFLEEAREILDPLRKELIFDDDVRLRRQTSDELFAVLRMEARVLEVQGRHAPALEALGRARPLASTRTALRDTLFQEESILRVSNDPIKHLLVLKTIEDLCSDLPLPPGIQISTLQPARDLAPGASSKRREAPVGVWVLFTRAEVHRRVHGLGDALADWHAVLADYGDLEISSGLTAGALARDEIHRVLLMPDGRAAYQRFERAAADLYAQALQVDDPVRLEEVGRLYPHSRAALDAMRARLDWAFAREETEVVAAIVYDRIEAAGGHDPEDQLLLLRLARSLGRDGNADFERELIRQLLREDPSAISDLEEHDGKLLGEVLQLLSEEAPRTAELTPGFDATVVSSSEGPYQGSYDFIGAVQPPTDLAEALPEELHVYLVNRERIEAFSNLGRELPAWTFPAQEPVRGGAQACAVATDRIIIGGMSAIWALASDGAVQWSRTTGELPVQHLASHAGLVLAALGTTDPERVIAFDAHTGVPLWEHHLGAEGRWGGPVFGDGKAVFFSQIFGRPSRARIVDLFRGTTVTEIELGEIPNNKLGQSAWIRSGRLIVPNFARYKPKQSCVVAYDLSSGRSVWRVDLRDTEDFWAVAYHGEEDYLVTLANSPTSSGAVYALDAAHGSVRTIVPLRIGEEPLGLEERRRTRLLTPYLFTLTETPGNQEVPIRAIHLPNQVRWTWTLPLAFDDLYHSDIPLPAVSADCVAIAFVRKNPDGFKGEARMVFMDRNTGKRQDTILLDPNFSHASVLELRGLGDALFVIGTGSARRGLRMQILEKIR